jgi:hypothetical protein
MSTQPQIMTEEEWRALGERLFGADLACWRFRCPTCGVVMSIDMARSFSDDEKERLRGRWSIEQECIGRYLPGRGCNWCAYGLFRGPHFVVRGDKKTPVFGFDIPVDQSTATKETP